MNEQDLVSRLLPLAGPLLGAVVGGLIATLTALVLERQKQRHSKREQLASLKREAIAAALEWMEPMRNAQVRAASLVMGALHGTCDDEHVLARWPDLSRDLADKDLTGGQRALLPADSYPRGLRIILELDELRRLAIMYGHQVRASHQSLMGFEECGAKLDGLEAQITQLETDLRNEFHATFK